MSGEIERDYFTDQSVLLDPQDYFDELRAKCPVQQLQSRDVVVVTGFKESVDVLNDPQTFSSVIAPGGPVMPLPFTPTGDDISDQLEAHRSEVPISDLLVALDDKAHNFSRSIMNKLFVPSRLKANERFISKLAGEMVRSVVARGGCEVIADVATPFVTLVIADLLGVPDDDREEFRHILDQGPPPGNMEAEKSTDVGPLEFMAGFFVRYLIERREHPRDDVLTELAQATFPDGSSPDIGELVRLATFLFGAGQDTSAKLIGNAMRIIAEDAELQTGLREEPALIPIFIEEVLRLEGSSKVTFRLSRRKATIGGTEVPAGQKIMIALGAANRDPRRWDDPNEMRFDRPRMKEHLAFGRGTHVCSGAPLARVEVRIILECFLRYTSSIALSEAEHGPPGDRRLDYEPSFIVRGLERLHLTFEPAADFGKVGE